MKAYVKPALEVISMKTAENIADDSIIKTIYTKAAGQTSYETMTTAEYNESADMGPVNS